MHRAKAPHPDLAEAGESGKCLREEVLVTWWPEDDSE